MLNQRRSVVALLALFALPLSAESVGAFDDHADAGITPRAGAAQFDAATSEYRVTGGGANIWAAVDAFHYVWKRVSGDITFTADVRFLGTGAVAHRKAALMIRQSLDPGAAYADVAVHGDGLTSLQFRPIAGDITQEIKSTRKGPVRIRIGKPLRALPGEGSRAFTGRIEAAVRALGDGTREPEVVGGWIDRWRASAPRPPDPEGA